MREPSGETVAYLWHDVRHAVAVILASVAAAEDDPNLGNEARRWLDHVADEARRIARICEHAGRDRGAPPLRRSLDEVTNEVVESIRVVSSTTIDFKPAGREVNVDGTAVERALVNVVDNACRAAGPRGRVCIAIEAGTDGSAVVTIDDSGPGFGATQRGASGLGLQVTRRVLGPLAGTVRIARHGPLGGARVQLLLPVSSSQPPYPTSGAAA